VILKLTQILKNWGNYSVSTLNNIWITQERKKQTSLETTLGELDPKRDNNRDLKEIMTERANQRGER